VDWLAIAALLISVPVGFAFWVLMEKSTRNQPKVCSTIYSANTLYFLIWFFLDPMMVLRVMGFSIAAAVGWITIVSAYKKHKSETEK